MFKFLVYLRILCENADFVFSMKAQVTGKRVILHKIFFMNYVWASFLEIRMSIDIFSNESVMLLLALSIYRKYHNKEESTTNTPISVVFLTV